MYLEMTVRTYSEWKILDGEFLQCQSFSESYMTDRDTDATINFGSLTDYSNGNGGF